MNLYRVPWSTLLGKCYTFGLVQMHSNACNCAQIRVRLHLSAFDCTRLRADACAFALLISARSFALFCVRLHSSAFDCVRLQCSRTQAAFHCTVALSAPLSALQFYTLHSSAPRLHVQMRVRLQLSAQSARSSALTCTFICTRLRTDALIRAFVCTHLRVRLHPSAFDCVRLHLSAH